MATTYTFSQIKIEVAENVGYDDGAGAILTGKDLTETLIGKYANRRYYELIELLASKYPEDYEMAATANFYKVTGTASSSSTGTTLVASTSIFDNDMIADTVYNSTDGTSAKITSYTNATTVTLNTTIDDDWDGDTIYVLGHEFTLGGDATDSRYIIRVEVAYDSATAYAYKTCERRGYTDLYKDGNETYTTSNHKWYKTSKSVSGVKTPAIGILPEATEPVGNGIRMTYIQMPDLLSNASDVPELPMGATHVLINGATIDAKKKVGDESWMGEYRQYYEVDIPFMVATYARSRVSNKAGAETSRTADLRLRRV